ncbi:MAG: 2'-5' RNA ligase family protein, partial [Clostridia bacterium]
MIKLSNNRKGQQYPLETVSSLLDKKYEKLEENTWKTSKGEIVLYSISTKEFIIMPFYGASPSLNKRFTIEEMLTSLKKISQVKDNTDLLEGLDKWEKPITFPDDVREALFMYCYYYTTTNGNEVKKKHQYARGQYLIDTFDVKETSLLSVSKEPSNTCLIDDIGYIPFLLDVGVIEPYDVLYLRWVPEPLSQKARLSNRKIISYDYHSLQLLLTEDMSKKIVEFRETIDEEDFTEDEKFDDPHVTLKYGLEVGKEEEFKKFFKEQKPFKVKFKKTSLFEQDEQDVLIVEVESEELMKLNELIDSEFAHVDTFPEYKPHCTVAYLKKGKGKKYAGKDILKGLTTKFENVELSKKDGEKKDIKIGMRLSNKRVSQINEDTPNLFNGLDNWKPSEERLKELKRVKEEESIKRGNELFKLYKSDMSFEAKEEIISNFKKYVEDEPFIEYFIKNQIFSREQLKKMIKCALTSSASYWLLTYIYKYHKLPSDIIFFLLQWHIRGGTDIRLSELFESQKLAPEHVTFLIDNAEEQAWFYGIYDSLLKYQTLQEEDINKLLTIVLQRGHFVNGFRELVKNQKLTTSQIDVFLNNEFYINDSTFFYSLYRNQIFTPEQTRKYREIIRTATLKLSNRKGQVDEDNIDLFEGLEYYEAPDDKIRVGNLVFLKEKQIHTKHSDTGWRDYSLNTNDVFEVISIFPGVGCNYARIVPRSNEQLIKELEKAYPNTQEEYRHFTTKVTGLEKVNKVEGQINLYKEMMKELIEEFESGKEKQNWVVIPKNDLKRLYILHAKGIENRALLDSICRLTRTIYLKLKVNIDIIENSDYFDWSYKSDEEIERFQKFISDEKGNIRATDYLYQLEGYFAHLKDTDYQKKMLALDRIINFVHNTGDCASWFVEGGKETLDEIANDDTIYTFVPRSALKLSNRKAQKEEDLLKGLENYQAPRETIKFKERDYLPGGFNDAIANRDITEVAELYRSFKLTPHQINAALTEGIALQVLYETQSLGRAQVDFALELEISNFQGRHLPALYKNQDLFGTHVEKAIAYGKDLEYLYKYTPFIHTENIKAAIDKGIALPSLFRHQRLSPNEIMYAMSTLTDITQLTALFLQNLDTVQQEELAAKIRRVETTRTGLSNRKAQLGINTSHLVQQVKDYINVSKKDPKYPDLSDSAYATERFWNYLYKYQVIKENEEETEEIKLFREEVSDIIGTDIKSKEYVVNVPNVGTFSDEWYLDSLMKWVVGGVSDIKNVNINQVMTLTENWLDSSYGRQLGNNEVILKSIAQKVLEKLGLAEEQKEEKFEKYFSENAKNLSDEDQYTFVYNLKYLRRDTIVNILRNNQLVEKKEIKEIFIRKGGQEYLGLFLDTQELPSKYVPICIMVAGNNVSLLKSLLNKIKISKESGKTTREYYGDTVSEGEYEKYEEIIQYKIEKVEGLHDLLKKLPQEEILSTKEELVKKVLNNTITDDDITYILENNVSPSILYHNRELKKEQIELALELKRSLPSLFKFQNIPIDLIQKAVEVSSDNKNALYALLMQPLNESQKQEVRKRIEELEYTSNQLTEGKPIYEIPEVQPEPIKLLPGKVALSNRRAQKQLEHGFWNTSQGELITQYANFLKDRYSLWLEQKESGFQTEFVNIGKTVSQKINVPLQNVLSLLKVRIEHLLGTTRLSNRKAQKEENIDLLKGLEDWKEPIVFSKLNGSELCDYFENNELSSDEIDNAIIEGRNLLTLYQNQTLDEFNIDFAIEEDAEISALLKHQVLNKEQVDKVLALPDMTDRKGKLFRLVLHQKLTPEQIDKAITLAEGMYDEMYQLIDNQELTPIQIEYLINKGVPGLAGFFTTRYWNILTDEQKQKVQQYLQTGESLGGARLSNRKGQNTDLFNGLENYRKPIEDTYFYCELKQGSKDGDIWMGRSGGRFTGKEIIDKWNLDKSVLEEAFEKGMKKIRLPKVAVEGVYTWLYIFFKEDKEITSQKEDIDLLSGLENWQEKLTPLGVGDTVRYVGDNSYYKTKWRINKGDIFKVVGFYKAIGEV